MVGFPKRTVPHHHHRHDHHQHQHKPPAHPARRAGGSGATDHESTAQWKAYWAAANGQAASATEMDKALGFFRFCGLVRQQRSCGQVRKACMASAFLQDGGRQNYPLFTATVT